MLGVEQGKAGDVLGGAPEPDHHRHAARARQHGDMAGRAALRQRDAAAGRPVGRQEAGRRDVLAEQDRAGRSCPVSGGCQRVEHLLAYVLQVGRPRPEIFVVRRFVAGDLSGERVGPRLVRWDCLHRSRRKPAWRANRRRAWRAGTPACRPPRRSTPLPAPQAAPTPLRLRPSALALPPPRSLWEHSWRRYRPGRRSGLPHSLRKRAFRLSLSGPDMGFALGRLVEIRARPTRPMP